MSKVIEGELDHVALGTVNGAMKLAKFYADVIGFASINFGAYERGEAHFPSVRVNAGTILDFFEPKKTLSSSTISDTDDETHKDAPGLTTALSQNTHICFALTRSVWDAVVERLQNAGVTVTDSKKRSGARGDGISVYCKDPEGNDLEFRYYPGRP